MAHKVLNLEEKNKCLVVNKEDLVYGRIGEIIRITLSMKHPCKNTQFKSGVNRFVLHSITVYPISTLSKAGRIGRAMFVHDLKCLCPQ